MGRMAGRLVVLGAVLVFLGGTALGVNLVLSHPAPVAQAATCETKTVARGEVLTSNLVMVNLYNGSNRAGLANRVKINLERRGFLGGLAVNNPGSLKTKNVMILTSTPDDPKVKLVRAQFRGPVTTTAPDFKIENGISVLIGSDYKGLKRDAPSKFVVKKPVSVCVPTINLP